MGDVADGRYKLSPIIKEAVWCRLECARARSSHRGRGTTGEVKVNLTKKAFRGSLKAYVELSEKLIARLLRIGHLKVRWVTCTQGRKDVNEMLSLTRLRPPGSELRAEMKV